MLKLPTPGGRLYALAVDRPVATTMIVVAICVFGALSYGRLRVALMPELTYPTMTVRTNYAGAAPEEVEREVARPIEEALRTVEDLAGISSVSRAGTTDVVLEFHWGTDMDYATQKVRERIDMLDLPEGVERPQVLRYDPELDPILRLGLTAAGEDLAAVRRYAEEEVKRVLEKIPGVAIVRVSGGQEPIVRIELDEGALSQRGLDAARVIERLRAENVNLAGGRLDDGSIEYLVRTLAEFESLSELEALIVGWQGQVAVRLGQVARVEQALRDREVITRIGERESVEIEIFKEADANIVEVAERVHLATFGDPSLSEKETERVTWLTRDMPEGMRIEVLSDRSVFIRAAISEVVDTAVLGGVLAIVVLFLFLRSFYATTTLGLAIPLSLVVTFAALYLGDVTLNIMSLGGLALGIGMLVDNAVVVLESIYRCREEGDEPREAAIRGAYEVGGAVVASTLTTIAVFFPIVFVEGVAGQIFGDLALAVVFSLLASLLVALFFVPTLAARSPSAMLARFAARGEAQGAERPRGWRRLAALRSAEVELQGVRERWRRSGLLARILWRGPVEVVLAPYRLVRTAVTLVLEVAGRLFGAVTLGVLWAVTRLVRWVSRGLGLLLWPLLWVFERGFELFRRSYEWVLDGALRNRLAVLGIAAGLSWGAVTLYGELGLELIPTVHQGELRVDIALPVESSLDETALRAAGIERALSALEVVASTSSVIGVREDASADSDEGANTARITVLLAPSSDLAQQEARALAAMREVLAGQPGVEYEIERPSLFSLKTPVAVEIRGEELSSLREASRSVVAALAERPGLTEVRSSLSRGYPEIHVRLDRDAIAARGLSARQVADAVRQTVQGVSPTVFRTGERRLDILVRLDRRDIADRAALEALVIKPRDTSGPPVALASVAQISPPTEGPSEIRRVEGQRVVLIEAVPQGLDLAAALAQVESALRATRLPRDVEARVAGQSAELDTALSSLLLALGLAVFLVYVVMASQFESLSSPLVILLTIPLGGIGVVGALWLTSTPVSVVVFIGVIMLAGIVVNNAIVLVDYIIQLRGRGLSRGEAIRTACSVRLRPVLITTLTTVFGLMPLALGLGEGAEMRAPMAITVMAGLASSTVLTLVVVPVVYDLIGEVGRTRASDNALQ